MSPSWTPHSKNALECRDLKRDFFGHYALDGFAHSMWLVQPFYLRKEDSVGQESFNVDWSNPEQVSLCVTLLGGIDKGERSSLSYVGTYCKEKKEY